MVSGTKSTRLRWVKGWLTSSQSCLQEIPRYVAISTICYLTIHGSVKHLILPKFSMLSYTSPILVVSIVFHRDSILKKRLPFNKELSIWTASLSRWSILLNHQATKKPIWRWYRQQCTPHSIPFWNILSQWWKMILLLQPIRIATPSDLLQQVEWTPSEPKNEPAATRALQS